MISLRRAEGRYYTPAAVADLTVSVALGDFWPPSSVLDPSCGDGAMLLAAERRGLAGSRLFGRDRDPSAIVRARGALPAASLEVADLFEPFARRFRAIVGNPPYVRSERLSVATRALAIDCFGQDDFTAVGAELARRGDLAALALWRSALLLDDGGRLGFVVSSALLDADYAEPLWRALSSLGAVREIVSAPAERWFADAAVNTIIVVFERGARASCRVAKLRRSTADCAHAVSCASDLDKVADVHTDASGSPRRWAHLLRAPAAWLEIENSAAFTQLGEVATIKRGMTTGANEIFYMTRADAKIAGIEPSVLCPLVRSPPRAGDAAIAIDPNEIGDVVIRAPDDLSATPGVAAYLGGHGDAAARPTLSARSPWWKLPSRPARLFLAKAYARRFVQRLSPIPLDCDQRVYAVFPAPGVDVEVLAAILNGSLTALAIESLGRASMGEGALEWTVADARSLPILDPRPLGRDPAVLAALAVISRRPIGPFDEEAERADRVALDAALLANESRLAGLADDVRWAVARSSLARERRASALLAGAGSELDAANVQ